MRISNSSHRSRIGVALCSAVAMFALLGAARAADDYPNRSVRIIVPFAAGGGTDVVIRLIAEQLTRILGQSFYVENVPGAGGKVATTQAVKAAADGYTLVATSPGPEAIYPALAKNMPYDADKDMKNITVISAGPGVAVVSADSRFKSIKDVIAEAKAKPGTITVGSSGIGAFSHINCELFKALAGVNVIHVPYRGAGPAAQDIIGGRVDMTIEYYPANAGLIKAGKLRPLAVTTKTRYSLNKDVPTMEEEGVQGFNTSAYVGLATPAGTPKTIIDKINQVVVTATKDPAFIEKLSKMGVVAVGDSPSEADAFFAHERAVLRDLGKKNGITLE